MPDLDELITAIIGIILLNVIAFPDKALWIAGRLISFIF